MMRLLLLSGVFTVLLAAGSVQRKGQLPKELKEVSGWVFVNDTTLIAHNDGGNESILYVLNLNGSIRHQTKLSGITNIDFEDIATDGKTYLYLGDFGNNNNDRTDLVIYKLNIQEVLTKESVTTKAIKFSYTEQKTFPAAEKERYYDAEAMAFYNDSIWIYTKCRAVPFDGKCMIYGLPTTPGTYKVKRKTYLKIGKRNWLFDSVTAADIYKKELHLLTYSKILIYTLGDDGKGTFKTQISINPVTQKEALAVKKNGKIYVTDERQKIIGGGTIFVVTKKKKKK
ncbi:MAG: hypothetical protein QE487_02250 [Fluviicola sp.]|nr:hypothetical protein [Fluviicola sp.]